MKLLLSLFLMSIFAGPVFAGDFVPKLKQPLEKCLSPYGSQPPSDGNFRLNQKYLTEDGGCLEIKPAASFELSYVDKSGVQYSLREKSQAGATYNFTRLGLLANGKLVFQDQCRVFVVDALVAEATNKYWGDIKIKSVREIKNLKNWWCGQGGLLTTLLAVFSDNSGFYVEIYDERRGALLELRKFDVTGAEVARSTKFGVKTPAEFKDLSHCQFAYWNTATPSPWTYLDDKTPMQIQYDFRPSWYQDYGSAIVSSHEVVVAGGSTAIQWKFDQPACNQINVRSKGWPCSCTAWSAHMSPPNSYYDFKIILDQKLQEKSFDIGPVYNAL